MQLPSMPTTSPIAPTANGWRTAAIRESIASPSLCSLPSLKAAGQASSHVLHQARTSCSAIALAPTAKRFRRERLRTIRVFEVETRQALRPGRLKTTPTGSSGSPSLPTASGQPGAGRGKAPTKVTSLEKKESLVTFPGHAQPVYTVSFTPDGKSVSTGGEDNRVRTWNPDNDGKSIREISGFGGTVFKLRYSPDGKNLLAAAGDKTVQIFDTKGSRLRKLEGHNDWVYALAISPDSKASA